MAKIGDVTVKIHADDSPLLAALDRIRDAMAEAVAQAAAALTPVFDRMAQTFAEFWHDQHVAWYESQPWPVRWWHTVVGHRDGDAHGGPHL